MANTTASRSYYRKSVIMHVEKTCKRVHVDNVSVYLSGVTDEDIAYWGKRFKSCKRGAIGYVEFRTL